MKTASDFLKEAIGGRPTPRINPPQRGFGQRMNELIDRGSSWMARRKAVRDAAYVDQLADTSELGQQLAPILQDPTGYARQLGESAAQGAADAAEERIRSVADQYKTPLGIGAGALGMGGIGALMMMFQNMMNMNQMSNAMQNMQGVPYNPMAQMNPAATQQALQSGQNQSWRV